MFPTPGLDSVYQLLTVQTPSTQCAAAILLAALGLALYSSFVDCPYDGDPFQVTQSTFLDFSEILETSLEGRQS